MTRISRTLLTLVAIVALAVPGVAAAAPEASFVTAGPLACCR